MTAQRTRFSALMLGLAITTSLSLPMVAMANDVPAAGSPAATKCGMNQGKHHGKGCGMMKELNLTEAQKQEFKARKEAFRKENAAAIDSLKAKHEQLKQLGTDAVNSEKVKQLRTELHTERNALHEKRKAAMKGILTPEQEQKLETMKQQHRAEHGKKPMTKPQP